MMRYFVYWQDVDKYIEQLSQKFKFKTYDLTGVYGLPRGGLVLAVMLSHRLNLPLLQAPFGKCIIIDDVADSGESLIHYANNTSNSEDGRQYYISTMYKKPKSSVTPDFVYREVSSDTWIEFPWERASKDVLY